MSNAKPKLQLVPAAPPVNPDFSRLVPHTGQTLAAANGLSTSPAADDPFATQLVPSSDLVTLLDDPMIRRRYREGRYVQGKNVSFKMAAWPTSLSVTTNAIVARCEPALGMNVVASLSLHIGLRAIEQWESAQHLKEIQQGFAVDSPKMSQVTVYSVKRLMDTLQPLPIGGAARSLVISEGVDDELKTLSGSIGMPAWALGPYCCMVVYVEQPSKYLNKHLREEMRVKVNELQKWLRWKARTIEAAVEEFDAPT